MSRSTIILIRVAVAVACFAAIIGAATLFGSLGDDGGAAAGRRVRWSRAAAVRGLDLEEEEAELDTGPGCHPRRADNPCHEARLCDTGGKINYLEWYYCTEPDARWLTMVVFFVLLAVYFYVLATVAEDFFCPTLALLSQMLALSPDVAGMTIMAFGNGMPDLFSSFAAVQQGQLPIALGALVGAGSFISLVVVACVAVVARVKVSKYPFCRDVAVYLLGIMLLALCVMSGRFHLWMAAFFVGYYVVYVTVSVAVNVVKNRRRAARRAKQEEQLDVLAADEKAELDQFYTCCSDETCHRLVYDAQHQQRELAHERSPTLTNRESAARFYAALLSATDRQQPAADDKSAPDSSTDDDEGRENKPLLATATKHHHHHDDDDDHHHHHDADHHHHHHHHDSDDSDDDTKLVLPLSPRSRTAALLSVPGRPDLRSQHQPLKRHDQADGQVMPDELVEQVLHEYRNVDDDNLAFLTSRALDARLVSPPTVLRAPALSDEERAAEAAEERRVRMAQQYCCKVSCDRSMFAVPWRRLPSLFLRRIEWHDKSLFEKIVWVLMSPVTLALNLTVPRVEEDSWHKLMAVLNPLFAPLLICMATDSFHETVGQALPLPVLLLLVGAPISALIFCTTTSKLPRRMHLYLLAAFVLSIFWVYVTADELVSLLQSIGYVFKISPTILGLTVLAWGNSTGDLISNIVIARQGFPRMAVAAAYGGPLFNLMIGLGVSLTVVCAATFPRAYPAVMSTELACSFVFLALGLAATLLTVPFAGFVVTRKYAFFLIAVFAVQTASSLVIALKLE